MKASPFSTERLDLWLDTFFKAHILTGQGLYQEPGHPNSYDLFTRYHLADMLVESYDGHYANPAPAFLAVAVSNGLNRPFTEPSGGRKASLLLEHDPTCRAVLHNGIYSLHFNARPAPDYDAFGVVDLTFGPGRFLQFVSSAKHLESGRFLNLGMASSSGSSRDDLALIGRMEGGLTPPRLELEARTRGSPYRYRFAARVQTEGVYIEEAAPGLEVPNVLLIPYLRDLGTGTVTEARVEGGRVRLVHGLEEVEISYGAPVRRVVHLTGGLQNRRGLCGLLRIEFRKNSAGISYHIRAVR